MTIELKKRDYAITVHDIDLDYIKGSEVRIIEDGFIHHYLAISDIPQGVPISNPLWEHLYSVKRDTSIASQRGLIPELDMDNLPPPFDTLEGRDREYLFFECLRVGIDSPNGYVLGRIGKNQFGDQWSLAGNSAGFQLIDGVLSVQDSSQITTTDTRVIEVSRTRNNLTQTTKLEVSVYDDAMNARFVVQHGNAGNDGKQPHKPILESELSVPVSYLIHKIYYRRGDTFELGIIMNKNQTFGAFGDPHLDKPKMIVTANTALVQNNGNYREHLVEGIRNPQQAGGIKGDIIAGRENTLIKDIDFNSRNLNLSGTEMTGYIPLYVYGTINLSLLRITLSGNIDHANSSGIRLNECKGTKIEFLRVKDVYGDGVYGKGVNKGGGVQRPMEIAFSYFDAPKGGRADCIQFTEQGSGLVARCYDIWVHDCVCLQSPESNSLKGSMAIEANYYLVENCIFGGKFFGVGLAGRKGTYRHNLVYFGGIPADHPAVSNTSGIGSASELVSHSISMYDNTIGGHLGMASGILISGYNLGDTNDRENEQRRFDILVNHNRVSAVRWCVGIRVPWTGEIVSNLSFDNTISDVYQRGNSDVLGDYVRYARDSNGDIIKDGNNQPVVEEVLSTINHQIIEAPKLSSKAFRLSRPLLPITGTPAVGNTLSVSADSELKDDEKVESYQWRMNGQLIPNANQASYTVTELVEDPRKPRFSSMNSAEFSCVVTISKNGDRNQIDFLYSEYLRA
ncbi:hypothetical protein VIBNISO65_110098 [Vibrio nigripulchritudo SO65]|uniref:hypothetical protein n=1 Tax=Vibrio nigripulchritudo TaxID=28173 RepID=UPI0003B1AB32|nr:hypothetical protein [Vibrio nigripulchritudo]CCN37006.1 hypothetical protein VIBNIAM115_480090 [Vibrio nigripulchritudo AM115]CCN41774.1 hypothetical protein VIBNIFTn2_210018 [Vibrio nigripulchritudo FTn2]CCN66433.1 hypothetical protein VIBNIPon4_530225 [Vibrio nigripulchritudo POn4]CCN74527.1 hypothetical protein VIBNISO65_110098 [Vibrio nigripulchritudo SO65]